MLSLPDFVREVNAKSDRCISYQLILNAVLTGRIPAGKSANGRWSMSEDDVADAVQLFVKVPA